MVEFKRCTEGASRVVVVGWLVGMLLFLMWHSYYDYFMKLKKGNDYGEKLSSWLVGVVGLLQLKDVKEEEILNQSKELLWMANLVHNTIMWPSPTPRKG